MTARSLDVDPARLDVFLRRARLEVEHGPLPSAQVAVAAGGRLVAFETYGDATNESRYILQSVGRTVVAGVVWKLLGDGLLGLDERVADVIPEFATNGKEVVTVHQVLTHTAGFPFAPLGYPKMLDRDRTPGGDGEVAADLRTGHAARSSTSRRRRGSSPSSSSGAPAARSPSTCAPRSSSRSASGSCCPSRSTATTSW